MGLGTPNTPFLFLSFSTFLYIFTLQLVSAHQTLTAQAAGGGAFGGGSREPNYRIKFHPEDAPFYPDEDQESVLMPDKNGTNFLCHLPKVETPKSGKITAQWNTSSMVMESEKQLRVKTPDELLEMLKDRCLLRQEGWWSYEFCYHEKLRQLHLEDGKVIQEFILGVFDPKATTAYSQNLSDISTLKDSRSKDASQRYHSHQYTNGTACDLTDQPRETEVRFVCSEASAMISSISELSTCKYALVVHAPVLCKHPMFQEETPVWHTINCNLLPRNVDHTKADVPRDEKRIELVTETEHPLNLEAEAFAA